VAIVEEAWQEMGASFERFWLAADIATLATMMEEDAARLCGPVMAELMARRGTVAGRRRASSASMAARLRSNVPVCARDGGEVVLPSWETAQSEDLLGKWALNLMLINVSTRRFGRAVRLPEGD
jgi:putative transposase